MNRTAPSAGGACGYQKCPKWRLEHAEFRPQYRVQRLACRAMSASAELPKLLTAEQGVDDRNFAELDGQQHQRFGGVGESLADEATEIPDVTHLGRMHRLHGHSS